MEIPVYNALDYDNALTEGAFEIAGFRDFIESVVGHRLYDNEQQCEILTKALSEGTENLDPDQLTALSLFISHFNSTCRRCGNEFTWEEMDPYNETIYCSSCRHDLEELQGE